MSAKQFEEEYSCDVRFLFPASRAYEDSILEILEIPEILTGLPVNSFFLPTGKSTCDAPVPFAVADP